MDVYPTILGPARVQFDGVLHVPAGDPQGSYTTNAIVNGSIRKGLKTRRGFPTAMRRPN
jgi:hypothetical protein